VVQSVVLTSFVHSAGKNFVSNYSSVMFMNNQQMHLFFSSLLFYSVAPACFDTCVSSLSSSVSCSLPAELRTNRMHRDRCIPGLHITDTLQRTTQKFIKHCIRFECNSAGTEELPDDDAQLSKHVGAAE
jgi:hypothetical protein